MTGAWIGLHRRSILLAIAILAMGGALCVRLLPVGLFPLVDFPRIVVSVDAGDRPVDRMVVEVTRPLESALRSVPNVQRIRSTSSRGSAEVSLSFAWGTDMVTSLLQAEAVVSRSLVQLPAGTSFTVRRMDPTVFPVLGLSVTSPNRPLTSIRDLAVYQLAPALSSVAGVADVEVLGGRQKEYQVLLDPELLRSHGLTPADVAHALSAGNVVTAVGRLEDHYRLYLALSDTRLRTEQEIRSTLLKSTDNGVVDLEDVGKVVLGEAPEWTRVNADGKDAVLINIKQQRGANTVALVADVQRKLAEISKGIPADVRIANYYDQSELIVSSAASVRDAILIGAVLAGLVLLAFLRNFRITLVISLVLPTVLLSACVLLYAFGQSFNIMTLGGMAAAVGLVVDDAVVMLEHIARRLGERDPDDHSEPPVLGFAAEMLRPLAGSSAATVVVFIPLAFLGGVAGSFFRPLALTMAITLTVSFLVALLAVPLLARMLLRAKDAATLESSGPLLTRLRGKVQQASSSVLRRPLLLAVPLVVLVASGLFAYLHLPSGFMPRMDEGGFIFDYRSAPGTSLTETDRLMRQVEKIVTELPDVESYSRRTGLQLGGGLTEANEGDMFIKLKPMPRRPIEVVMSDLRQRVAESVPGLTVETAQLMEDLIGDLISNPQPIEIKIFGANDAALRKTGASVAQAIAKLPGVVEVFDGTRIAGDAIEIRFDRVRAALEGLDPESASAQVNQLLAGVVTSQIQSGEAMIGIRIWTPLDSRQRIEQLRQFKLRSPAGQIVPLARIADVETLAGQAQQTRENLREMVAVTARLEGRDLGSAIRDIKRTVAALNLPAGVGVEYGGIYAEQQRSFKELMLVFAGALLLVATLLMYLYERISIVVSILATALLTLPGVFVGLSLTGTELDLSSMMGLTMVMGIVTEVAVFYFAELDTSARIGPDDLLRACAARLRPILMTSAIAILALAPLALGLGTGSEMQRPLAITIISGLLVAVPLVLLVMPGIFLLLDRRGTAQPDGGDPGPAE
ncbi:MAG TPA: efflux RND transporter permease subunit [Dokdonella sp.]|nr:efflux RND transporter permease subunit [Dokdonella sp.]